MAVPQSGRQGGSIGQSNAPEPIGQHLRRIAAAACWAVAPVIAGLLLFGKLKLGLSVLGGAFVSFSVFATLRVMVYRALGILAPQPGVRPEPPGPAAMAQFALGTFVKFLIAIAIVFGMFKLGANLLALLGGFVIAQIAIAVVVSRGLKGPV
jgi:hypothetical protein